MGKNVAWKTNARPYSIWRNKCFEEHTWKTLQGCTTKRGDKTVFSPNAHSEANIPVCLALRRQASNAGRKQEVANTPTYSHVSSGGVLCAVRLLKSTAFCSPVNG